MSGRNVLRGLGSRTISRTITKVNNTTVILDFLLRTISLPHFSQVFFEKMVLKLWYNSSFLVVDFYSSFGSLFNFFTEPRVELCSN